MGKIISVKRNHKSNLFLFSNSDFPLASVATFSGQLYFGRSYFFTLFQSIYFDTAITFLGQLFLQNSCLFFSFSEKPLFRRSYFFQNSFFLRSETSTEQPLFENKEFFYGNYFLQQPFYPEELFRTNISKKELIF